MAKKPTAFRIDEEMASAVTLAAKQDCVSMAGYIRALIVRDLKARGIDPNTLHEAPAKYDEEGKAPAPGRNAEGRNARTSVSYTSRRSIATKHAP